MSSSPSLPLHMFRPVADAQIAVSVHPGDAEATTGLVLVSGGVQTRIGAHRSYLCIAQAVAAQGYPVVRYDRRGVGDSTGSDPGFQASGPDLQAAIAALLTHTPTVTRLVGFALCDGALALVEVAARERHFAAIMLANPWTPESENPELAAGQHYGQRLRDPAALRRVLSGRYNIAGLLARTGRYLRALLGSNTSRPSPEAVALIGTLAALGPKVHLLLSRPDRTAALFERAALRAGRPGRMLLSGASIVRVDDCDHSFSSPGTRDKLVAAVVGAVRAADQHGAA